VLSTGGCTGDVLSYKPATPAILKTGLLSPTLSGVGVSVLTAFYRPSLEASSVVCPEVLFTVKLSTLSAESNRVVGESDAHRLTFALVRAWSVATRRPNFTSHQVKTRCVALSLAITARLPMFATGPVGCSGACGTASISANRSPKRVC
jgi:hypothetical protein